MPQAEKKQREITLAVYDNGLNSAVHTRESIIPSDLVICGCGAIGVVETRGWWIFTRYRIRWTKVRVSGEIRTLE